MKQALFLASRSLLWHRRRALTIVLSLAVVIWVPLTVRLLLHQFRTEITARAAATPLVVGATGSRLDLVLHALYFESLPPTVTTMSEATAIANDELGVAIPLHARFNTQSRPSLDGAAIVGTSPEYFEFRSLKLSTGEPFALIGECVVGASVAERWELTVGDSMFSAPENAMNLAGNYPLKMRVVGILARSSTPDDLAVFTDVQTTWIIEGIGHGHQDVTASTDPALLLEPATDLVNQSVKPALIANASVLPYTEITPDNLESFHFHGDPETFPVTAIIVVPNDDKSRARILGRFTTASETSQCLKPPDVIAELLAVVFRIEQFVWLCSLAAVVVAGLLLWLVLNLSMKLRAAEMLTMFRLGCSRRTVASMYAAEILLLVTGAIALAGIAATITVTCTGGLIRNLLF